MFTINDEIVNRLSRTKLVWCSKIVPNEAIRRSRPDNTRVRKDDFIEVYEYVNDTAVPVAVCDRQNVMRVYHPRPANTTCEDTRGSFVIRLKRYWRANVSYSYRLNDVKSGMVKFDGPTTFNGSVNDPNSSALQAAYDGRLVSQRNGGDKVYDFCGNDRSKDMAASFDPLMAEYDFCMSVEYHHPLESFNSNGGVIYCKDTDRVLSLQVSTPLIHPMSRMGESTMTLLNPYTEQATKSSFSYHVELINNTRGPVGDRFVLINDIPRIVKERSDPNLPEGVHIYTSDETAQGYSHVHIPLSDTQALVKAGVFTTLADAEAYRGVEAARMKLEMEREKHRRDREIDRRNEAEAIRKEEAEQIKRQEETRRAEALLEAEKIRAKRDEDNFERARRREEEMADARARADKADEKRRFWDGVIKIATATIGLVAAGLGLLLKYGPAKK